MGWVSLPPPPARSGALVVQGELDVGELSSAIATLCDVLQLVQADGGGAGTRNGLAARLGALSFGPDAVRQQHPDQGPLGSAAAAATATAPSYGAAYAPGPPFAGAPPAAHPTGWPMAVPLAVPSAALAPQPVPAAAPELGPHPVPQPQPVTLPQAPPQPEPQPLAQALPLPAPTRAAPPAGPAWVQCWASDAADHGGNAVSALTWVPQLHGLPGGDGHMGWLVSASRGILNLFECNAGGGAKGEPSLMLMHAQEVDFLCSRLAAEPTLNLLFAVSLATSGAAQECVSVHSLDAELLLAYRYRFAPPGAVGGGRVSGGTTATRLINHVVSLSSVGGVLARCCAASYGGRLVVFEAPSVAPPAGTTVTATRNSWDAHPGASVTALHLSPAEPTLYSGANSGAINAWDLRARPKAPATVMAGHQRNVTGLGTVHDSCLASCGIDGKVLLWDPRRPSAPYTTIVPDGAPALRLVPSPFGDCLAVSTNRGLHCVDLVDSMHGVVPIAPFPLPRPFADIAWNSGTGELYAAGGGGSVSVFSRAH